MPSFPWTDLHEQLGQGSTGNVHIMCMQLQVRWVEFVVVKR